MDARICGLESFTTMVIILQASNTSKVEKYFIFIRATTAMWIVGANLPQPC